MPSVDDPNHAFLEKEVSSFLFERNYLMHEGTYHATMPAEMVKALIATSTPTALYLRSRADRVAVHPNGSTFEWEAKTVQKRTGGSNFAIEALPLAHHYFKSLLGAKIMYCCWDPRVDLHVGFWSSSLPTIIAIHLPQKYAGLRQYLVHAFPDIQIIDRDNTRGSNDPYVLIGRSAMEAQQDWRDLIDAEYYGSGQGHLL